ncbi:MAG: hypothetical protein WAM98_11185 [Terriglobales bacterium]
MNVDAETAWKNSVAMVRAAPVIVNTIDGAARLVTFTMPLGAAEVKDLVLDAKDVEKQPLTLHVTIWIEEIGKSTRLYVRAAPNGGGFFSHSNGQIEQHILDAIEKRDKWMPLSEESSAQQTIDTLPGQAQEAAVAFVMASKQLILNASSSDLGVVTLSLMIPSADLSKFVPKLAKHYYPGVAHVTLWFEPSGSGTRIRTRTLVFESGSLSPVPLTSNGQLESAILDAVQKRLKGVTDATFAIGSDYRGKPEFWNVLFGINATSNSTEATPSLTKDLPVTIEKAWAAGLQVITQSKVIVSSDRSAGTFEFLTAHTSQIGTKYAVHRVIIRFTSTDFGTRMSIVIPHAQETTEESENDLKLYAEQIGTELFVKDRLKWLTDKKGLK